MTFRHALDEIVDGAHHQFAELIKPPRSRCVIDPGDDGFVITPSDTEDLDIPTRGLYVGVVGDVKVDMISGSTLTFVSMVAGIVHPLQVRRVYSTGTDATDIVGVV